MVEFKTIYDKIRFDLLQLRQRTLTYYYYWYNIKFSLAKTEISFYRIQGRLKHVIVRN